jgi:D-sedoheptulose 7-phosphate isomerase
MKQKIESSFKESIKLKKKILDTKLYFSISRMSDIASKKIENGGKIFLCGNGGSAADAQHLAAELMVRLKPDNNRIPLPAIALSLDVSTITACSNDFGYEKIFERSIQSLGNSKDILIAITTSGNSKNIINAIKKAKLLGIQVFGFLGSGGGKALKYCDQSFVVPSYSTARIQESHITAGHALMECIEENLFKSDYLKKY